MKKVHCHGVLFCFLDGPRDRVSFDSVVLLDSFFGMGNGFEATLLDGSFAMSRHITGIWFDVSSKKRYSKLFADGDIC